MSLLDPAEHDNRAVNGLAVLVLAGLVVLLVGLWWIQVASRHTYQGQLEIQAVRTVRVPAARGRILDRTGVVLADTQPSFNLGLYLEELSREFRQEYGRIRPVEVVHRASLWTFGRGSAQVVTQAVRLSRSQLEELQWTARLRVVSNAVRQLSEVLGNPIAFDAERFRRHYLSQLALPYPVLVNLKVEQAARVAEAPALPQGADIDVLPLRVYPFQATAGHLLGYLIRDDRSAEGEEADYSYRLPDYRGVVGIEAAYDSFLRGRAGVKSVWVNHLGYKQAEQIWSPAEPGLDVVLTLDWRIQLAAEQALLRVGANVRGAVVALDVNTGDVLALVSVPGLNPNHFVTGFPAGEYDRLRDPLLRAQVNRATQEQYVPGSILKPLVALAALDRGLNPSAPYMVQSDPARPDRGCIYVGRRKIRDTAPPGEYNLRRALLRSSNSYFVHHGLQPGVVERLAELGVRLGLGQKIGAAYAPGSSRRFPFAGAGALRFLAGRGYCQPLHGTGPGGRDALADGSGLCRPGQWRPFAAAALSGPFRGTVSSDELKRPAVPCRLGAPDGGSADESSADFA